MLVGAMQSGGSNPPVNLAQTFSYDAHADWELSRLLSALDEQSRSFGKKNTDTLNERIREYKAQFFTRYKT